MACPRGFCEPELQNKFKVTRMKEHLSIVCIGKKKGCSLPLNVCSHTSACKQQNIFKHRHFQLCPGIPITCQVLCNVCFIYFIVSLCQIVLSSTGLKNMKVAALTNSAGSLSILESLVMYTELYWSCGGREHKPFS